MDIRQTLRTRRALTGLALLCSSCLCSFAASAAQPHFSPPIGAPIDPALDPALVVDVITKIDTHHKDLWKGRSFEDFLKATYKEPFEGGKYIVDGDVAIADEKLLREFFLTKVQSLAPISMNNALTLGTIAGEDNVWASVQQSNLMYCVSKTFGTRYTKVVADMDGATKAWSAVAAVKYIHVTTADDTCTSSNTAVVFNVMPVNVRGQYLARSFFPQDNRPARQLLIDDTAFSLDPHGKLQLVGILRHELGHTLGFRHEQTRPEAGKCFEDNDWKPLTSYDNLSVMHYPQCNGGGDWSLILTAKDQSGAACEYGAAPGFSIDTSICMAQPRPPKAVEAPVMKNYVSETVALNQDKKYGPFTARPGTTVVIKMTGSGNHGDPDLYVRRGEDVDIQRNFFSCRPYLTGPNETCTLDAGISPKNVLYVVVRGASPASFNLGVSFTPQ